jgi:flagellar protein FliL
MSDAAKPAAASGGSKKLIIIVVVAVLVSVGAAVGVTLALMGGGHKDKEVASKHEGEEVADEEDEEGEESADEGGEGAKAAAPTYVALDPAFVVNFQDKKQRTKYLKAEISVVASTAKVQEALTLHMPAVRNSLVLLLSRQVFEDLESNEGKEKLRSEALHAVQDVIKEQTTKKTAKGVKDLYFSSLVMQ